MPHAGAVIMEIGCSSGFLIKDLVKSFPEAVVLGADVVKEPLYRLASAVPGVPLMRFDLLQCPLPARSIDVLIMLNVLEHIEDDVGALKKAFDLLKPGGHLVVEVPASPFLYDAYDAALHHFRRYSASELRDKLTGAGFEVNRRSHIGFVLFPAFALVKLMNKCFPRKDTRSVVREQAATSSGSSLVRWAMFVESRFLSRLRLPWGIRAVAVARKGPT
jgi:SAM-dependent methyltransferase